MWVWQPNSNERKLKIKVNKSKWNIANGLWTKNKFSSNYRQTNIVHLFVNEELQIDDMLIYTVII